jgi:hypothetical protein
MIYWIKRGARIIGYGVFFVVFAGVLLRSSVFTLDSMVTAAGCAFLAGITSWFIGLVISDIVVKGIVTDIGDTGVEEIIEGGILQRVQTLQEQLVPGGRELPFVGPVKERKKTGKKQNRRDRNG